MMMKYRGRIVTDKDIAFIKRLIAEHPDLSRRRLSQELCRAWNWVQPNGALKDMVCRGLMLELHRNRHIELPPRRQVPPNPLAEPRKPLGAELLAREMDQAPLCAKLADLKPLAFCQVRRTSSEQLFNALIERYHYLGYTQPVGEHLKYMVYAKDRVIACLAWCSAPRHIGCRDRFIGWTAQQRRQHIDLIAYNTRFLILPWVQVRYLASHILGRMARLLPGDWERIYHHRVHYLETFVDPERYKGTCYRAANWVYLGMTTGRGKDAPTRTPNRSFKEVLGYPLSKGFREMLAEGAQ
jgi:hypothetical protein